MKIQILNKNNNAIYQIVEGSVPNFKYNEDLDSYTLMIKNQTTAIDIEPYDKVILIDDEGRLANRYMLVDTYNEIERCINPSIYDYEISLMSEIKELEGIILPNISITPLRTGTKLTIYEVLNQYLQVYGRYIKIGTTSSWSYVLKWRFSQNVIDRFSQIDAPELQWGTPTLREVFNDLFLVDNCIPTMQNGIIDFLDLTEIKNDITEYEQINYKYKNQSANDYVSEIHMNLENVMQTSVEGVNNQVVTDIVKLMPQDDDDYVITSENAVIKTRFPILRLLHLYVYLPVEYTNGSVIEYRTLKVDLLNYIDPYSASNTSYSFVKEYDEYKSLRLEYYTQIITYTQSIEYYVNRQNYNLYYKRGTNIIDGLTQQTKQFASFSISTLSFIIVRLLLNGTSVTDMDNYNYWWGLYFEVEYETSQDLIFRASKDGITNERTIIDNQQFEWVDAFTQGKLEYQKANRLGNPQLIINARRNNDSEEPLIQIGDFLYKNNEKYIVYSVEHKIYKEHIQTNAYASKNYVLKNYFTGVRSKIRTWINAKDEAFIRNDINKVYCVFSFNQLTDKLPYEIITDYAYYLLSPFNSSDIQPIKYVAVRTEAINIETSATEYYPSMNETNYQWYYIACSSRVIGKSMIFSFGFENNYVASKYVKDGMSYVTTISVYGNYNIARMAISTTSDDTGTAYYGGIPLDKYNYTNTEGQILNVNWLLLNDLTVEGLDIDNLSTNAQMTSFAEYVSKRPLTTNNSFVSGATKMYASKTLYKDNKEISYIHHQVEFLSDSENIKVGYAFAQYQEAVRTITKPTISIYFSKNGLVLDDRLNDNSDVVLLDTYLEQIYSGYEIISEVLTRDITDQTASVEIVSVITPSLSGFTYPAGTYYIVDSNKNILISFRLVENESSIVLYLNILRNRDTNIYESQDNQIVIGHI